MKILSINKKINFNYIILKKITAGIILNGSETKSIKKNGMQITQSFISIIKNECFLYNSNINFLCFTNNINPVSPKRTKKLLLSKKEILNIKLFKKKQNLTIVPENVFINDNGLIKLKICLVKGKSKYDKRETMKKKDFLKRKKNIY